MTETDGTSNGLMFGAVGWEHPGWNGAYYPEDLPPDWRLSYYANEIRSVLVPAGAWVNQPAACLRAWHDDVDPGFRFVLECPQEVSAALAVSAAQQLEERLAALLLPRGTTSPPTHELPWLAHVSSRAGAGGWGRDGDDGRPAILILPDPGSSPRAQRHFLEEAVARLGPGGQRMLFIEGGLPAHVQNLKLLADMMGIA